MRVVLINIFGKVQMEGFRYRVLMEARSFSINGYVRNLRDGSVEIKAEGENSQVDKFIQWCKIGPPYASIKKTIVEETEAEFPLEVFDIL